MSNTSKNNSASPSRSSLPSRPFPRHPSPAAASVPVRPPHKPVDFTRTPICRMRVHCRACRTSAAWRASIMKAGLSASPDWDCPHGYTAEILPTAEAVGMARELEAWRQQNMPCCNKRKRQQPAEPEKGE